MKRIAQSVALRFSVAVAGGAVGVGTGRAGSKDFRFYPGLLWVRPRRRCQHDHAERKNWCNFRLIFVDPSLPAFRTPYLSPSSTLVACPLLNLLSAAPSFQYATFLKKKVFNTRLLE